MNIPFYNPMFWLWLAAVTQGIGGLVIFIGCQYEMRNNKDNNP